MEDLMVSKWNPVRQMRDILFSIKRLLTTFGGRAAGRHSALMILAGEVNPSNDVNDPSKGLELYSETEFQVSVASRVATHWASAGVAAQHAHGDRSKIQQNHGG